ncbi:protein kinase, partial [Candidatus Dependentiae bacterium]|nr:protein kinase [Candidatus Dependentiae bacterium]
IAASLTGIGFIFILITVLLKKKKKSSHREEQPTYYRGAVNYKHIEQRKSLYELKIKLLLFFKDFKFISDYIIKLQQTQITKIYNFCKSSAANPSEAIPFYEYLLSLGWDKPTEYFDLANLYLQLKLTDSAIKTLMKINPDKLEKEQIENYYVSMANLYHKTGNLGLAIRNLETAVRIFPEKSELYVHIADLSGLTKNFKKSADTYLEALKMDTRLVTEIETKLELILKQCQSTEDQLYVLHIFEQIYILLNNDIKLLNIYEMIRQIEPENITNLTKIGKLYFKLKMFREAFRLFKYRERIAPDLLVYRALAFISSELKESEEEMKYLYFLFNRDPKLEKEKIDRLLSLLKEYNDNEKLYEVYKKLIECNQDVSEYLKNLINLLIAKKDYTNLLDKVKTLITKFPGEIQFAIERIEMISNYFDDKISIYKTYIEIFGLIENTDKMEEYYLKMITEFPDTPLLEEKISLATIYKESNREKDAIKLYENITGFEKENIEILKNLGNLYLSQKMMREAKDVFERILKLNSDNSFAQSKIEYLENIIKNSHIMQFQDLLNDESAPIDKKIEIQYNLAKAYFDTGFFKLCIEELKNVLKHGKFTAYWQKSLELITSSYIENKQSGIAIQFLGNIFLNTKLSTHEELFLKYLLANVYVAHDDKAKGKALFEEIAISDDNYFDIQYKLKHLEDIKSSRDGLITLQYGAGVMQTQQQVKKSTLERYEIIKELGRGGMGVVYKARDLKLDRIVALKQLHANTDVNSESAKRLFLEAKAVAKLNHPNIVNVFDVGDSSDELYISMEFVEGKPLTEIIRSENYSFDITYFKNIASQICAGLDYAHSHNIVHRDIKPDNIMVANNNVIKIMDFGLAKQTDADTTMTQEGVAMGTAQYMSPEQIRGEDIDLRTDIYALGCMMYEIATKNPPFNSTNLNALIYKHLSVKPISLKSVLTDIPEKLDHIVMKCIEKDKNNRYSKAADIIEELKAV